MGRPTRVEIDLDNLKHNLHTLKGLNGDAFFCPMVKANGYGHGMIRVAFAAAEAGCDAVGVALVEEAIELRQQGFRHPVLTFAPLHRSDVPAILEYNITPVITRFDDLVRLDEAHPLTPLSIHVKFNTGMNRLGFDGHELPQLKKYLEGHAKLRVAGVCTHLTHGHEIASEPDGPTHRQMKKFLEMASGFPGVRHAHKSASLATTKKFYPEIGARPGIAIYGLPHEGRVAGSGLKPVLSWQSQLSNIHRVSAGQSVSYGGRWTAKRDSWIGVVPVGYGDGYMRALSNVGKMIYREAFVPVVGSVCMDYTLLDLTDAVKGEPAQIADTVTLIGQQGSCVVSAADIAEWAGTIAYEVVTGISRRVPRETKQA